MKSQVKMGETNNQEIGYPATGTLVADISRLKQSAKVVLERNHCAHWRGWQGHRRLFTYHAPSLFAENACPPWLRGLWKWIRPMGGGHYPHQWFWDSCFHAIALSHLDIRQACAEIEGLLYAQREDGFIPQIIWNRAKMSLAEKALSRWLYPSPLTSPYLQPPLLAEAVETVFARGGDLDFLSQVLPPLKRYYLYLDKTRHRNGDGLLEIISSYESGKDRSPEYDIVYGESNAGPAWRGPMVKLMLRHKRLGWDLERILNSKFFRVKDLLFNCIYAKNLMTMGRLLAIIGEEDEARRFLQKGGETEDAILNKMYNKENGLFFSLGSKEEENRLIKTSTVSSFMPLLLERIDRLQVERLVEEHLLNPEEFWLNYPVPAVPVGMGGGRDIIWRGQQTWIYTNWYITKGLCQQARRFPDLRKRYTRIAAEITRRSWELVMKEGFREFYDSRTGEGKRARDFSGSTLVLDMVTTVEALAIEP